MTDRASHAIEVAPVLLPAGQAALIRRHAESAYPRECCGVLLGISSGAICSAHPVRNQSEQAADRYSIDPRDIVRLDRVAESKGQEIIGFYHSHPDHPCAPSATDAEQAWPDYIYLIVSVRSGAQTDLKAWTYDTDRREFDERFIEFDTASPTSIAYPHTEVRPRPWQ